MTSTDGRKREKKERRIRHNAPRFGKCPPIEVGKKKKEYGRPKKFAAKCDLR